MSSKKYRHHRYTNVDVSEIQHSLWNSLPQLFMNMFNFWFLYDYNREPDLLPEPFVFCLLFKLLPAYPLFLGEELNVNVLCVYSYCQSRTIVFILLCLLF